MEAFTEMPRSKRLEMYATMIENSTEYIKSTISERVQDEHTKNELIATLEDLNNYWEELVDQYRKWTELGKLEEGTLNTEQTR